MFVWAPTGAAQVRSAFDDSDVNSVVLVPLEVGTALVVTEPAPLRVGILLSEKVIAKLAATTVIALWDDHAACVYRAASRSLTLGWDWGSDKALFDLVVRPQRFGFVMRSLLRGLDALSPSRNGRAKHIRVARRLAGALNAPEDIVLSYVEQWRRGGSGLLLEFFEATGNHDLARIARQVDAGSFEQWRGAPDLPEVPLVND